MRAAYARQKSPVCGRGPEAAGIPAVATAAGVSAAPDGSAVSSMPRGGVRRATPATSPSGPANQAVHTSTGSIVPSSRVISTVAGTELSTGSRSSQGSTRRPYAARSVSTTHSMSR